MDDVEAKERKKKKKEKKKKRNDEKNESFVEEHLGDNEEESFSIFGTKKRDTTSTHGPMCFCGCANPYWVDEEGMSSGL